MFNIFVLTIWLLLLYAAAQLRQKQVPPAQQTVKCKFQRRRHNYSEVENAQFDEEAQEEGVNTGTILLICILPEYIILGACCVFRAC